MCIQVFSSTVPEKPKSWTGLVRQGNALTFFIPSVANHQKIEGGPFGEKNEKKSQFRKKLKMGPFGIFQHPFCRKTPEKMKAETLRDFFV